MRKRGTAKEGAEKERWGREDGREERENKGEVRGREETEREERKKR